MCLVLCKLEYMYLHFGWQWGNVTYLSTLKSCDIYICLRGSVLENCDFNGRFMESSVCYTWDKCFTVAWLMDFIGKTWLFEFFFLFVNVLFWHYRREVLNSIEMNSANSQDYCSHHVFLRSFKTPQKRSVSLRGERTAAVYH